MEESLNKATTLPISQPEALEKKAPSPIKKNLRKRPRNFENLYGENFEVGSNSLNEYSDGPTKNNSFSIRKKALKNVRKFKNKYKEKTPLENTIITYFETEPNHEVLDYDDLLEKGLIFDKISTPTEVKNPHDLRHRPTKTAKNQKHNEKPHKKYYIKKKDLSKNNKAEEINLLKIHIENRKNSVNPRILDKSEDKSFKIEEKKTAEEPQKKLFTELSQKIEENPEKNNIQPPLQQTKTNNTNSKESFDYDKLFFIPKFQKMIDQNYANLSNTDKAYYQSLFYNRLMHFNNSFDYFNPYYNQAAYFGMPDLWSNFSNPFMNFYQKKFFQNPMNPMQPPAEEPKNTAGREEFFQSKPNNTMNNFPPFPMANTNSNEKAQQPPPSQQIPKSFFPQFKPPAENMDFTRNNDKPFFNLGEKNNNTNFFENFKLNNNNFTFEIPKIIKKVTFRKKEPMRSQKITEESIKVIPVIINNLENLASQDLYLEKFQEDIIDCDQICANTAGNKTMMGHKRTKTFYKLNKNLKLLKSQLKFQATQQQLNSQKIKTTSQKFLENPNQNQEKNLVEEEKKNENPTIIGNIYEKLKLDGLDIIENENLLIIDCNNEELNNKGDEKKDNENNEKEQKDNEVTAAKNLLFGEYNSEQLNQYMFQKHKINIGKKFQADIPKFGKIIKISRYNLITAQNNMENPSNMRLFREWKNNVIHQNEFEKFHKTAIEKLAININEEEAANIISIYGYDLDKASLAIDKNLYYFREFLLGFISFPF